MLALRDMTDKQLTTAITTAHRHLTRFKAEFIVHLTEFHERGLARRKGAVNTVDWAARTQDMSPRTTYEYLQVGRSLRPFLLLSSKFRSGDISYSKVRLLLRYLTEDNQAELVALALAHPLTELETLLSGRDRVNGTSRKAKNRLSVTICPETGAVRLWGELDPERGAEFLAALKHAEVTSRPDADEPAPEPDSSTTRFGAPVATSLIGAFFGMVHLSRTNPEAKATAPGAEVNVIISADERAYLPRHRASQGSDLLRSVINGRMSVHIRDARGRVIHLGRSSRLVNQAQEKALLTAWDFRCAAPGCTCTRWLEFHHILAWSHGGETNLDNLIPLCSTHHAMVTNGELAIVPDDFDSSLLRFRFPGGETYTSSDNRPPMFDIALGQHADGYTHGPVPRGDEHLVAATPHQDTFDDISAGQG